MYLRPLASAILSTAVIAPAVWAATGTQVGASGKTYASAGIQCALHPQTGMAPMVTAGLYNPKKNSTATVSLNGTPLTTVNFISPDTTVWLSNGVNTIVVAVNKGTHDTFTFDATSPQTNICIPDTSGNTVSNDLEYAASGKSYAVVTPGCAWNPLENAARPFVNLFLNGSYVLNVSVNNVPLTQLTPLRTHTPVFLRAGMNVISAANGAVSIDYFVRNGGTGACTLP